MTRRARTIPERALTTHARAYSHIERALARTGSANIKPERVHPYQSLEPRAHNSAERAIKRSGKVLRMSEMVHTRPQKPGLVV